MAEYQHKYFKYKTKYDKLFQLIGGNTIAPNIKPSFDSGNGDANDKRHLALLEYLTFQGANKQNWNIMKEIYDPDVIGTMANFGSYKGRDKHFVEMQKMYAFAPDLKVISHDIEFGSGEWTAVTQTMTGTATGTTYIDNTPYTPTGKTFKFTACALIKWKNDKIIQEIIFWDESDFKRQIGISTC